MFKKIPMIYLVVLAVVIIGAGIGVTAFMMKDKPAAETDRSQEVVAKVNGQELTMERLDKFADISGISSNLLYMAPEFAEIIMSTDAGEKVLDEYRKAKLDGLIEQEIIEQEAKVNAATDEERTEFFNSYIASVKAQNKINDEDLLNAIKQQGFDTLDSFKEHVFANGGDISILQKKVMDAIVIEDSAAKEYYDANPEQFKDAEGQPIPLEKVQADLKNYLLQEKQMKAWDEYVAKLKEKAKVEKFL